MTTTEALGFRKIALKAVAAATRKARRELITCNMSADAYRRKRAGIERAYAARDALIASRAA